MWICQQTVKQRSRSRSFCSKQNDFRRPVESGCKDWCCNKNHNPDQLGQNHCTRNPKPCSLFRTFIVFCPQILSHKSSKCHRKTCDRQKSKSFDLGISSTSCHCHLSKRIDIGLNYNICDGNDRVLDSGWKAKLNHLFENIPFKTNSSKPKPIFCLRAYKLNHTKNRTDQLGNVRS